MRATEYCSATVGTSPRVPTVERKCADDSTSLGDFVRTFGENSRATFSFAEQRIVRVTCTNPDIADTTPDATLDTTPDTTPDATLDTTLEATLDTTG